MQELINKVKDAAGVTDEQAQKSIETVSAYIKERMPTVFRDQIDHIVSGGTLSSGVKAKMNDVADEMRVKAEELIQEIRDKGEEAAKKIRDMFSEKK